MQAVDEGEGRGDSGEDGGRWWASQVGQGNIGILAGNLLYIFSGILVIYKWLVNYTANCPTDGGDLGLTAGISYFGSCKQLSTG